MKPCRICKQPDGAHRPHCSVAVVAEYGAHLKRETISDRGAIRIALELAIMYEESLIDSYRHVDDKDDLKIAAVPPVKQRIDAFNRVLAKYFGGKRKERLFDAKPVSLYSLMKNTAQ